MDDKVWATRSRNKAERQRGRRRGRREVTHEATCAAQGVGGAIRLGCTNGTDGTASGPHGGHIGQSRVCGSRRPAGHGFAAAAALGSQVRHWWGARSRYRPGSDLTRTYVGEICHDAAAETSRCPHSCCAPAPSAVESRGAAVLCWSRDVGSVSTHAHTHTRA